MNDKNKIHVLSRAVIIDCGHILLCKTLDLKNNFYFLPGGHVEHGESAELALLRELVEETGGSGTIKKFLGCLEYSFEPGHSSICHNHEYNFIFEVESEDLKLQNKIPQLENHIELVWVPFTEITEIDFRAEPLKKLIHKWLNPNDNDNFYSVMI
jgi:8-oxo-dGTP diphosphatase